MFRINVLFINTTFEIKSLLYTLSQLCTVTLILKIVTKKENPTFLSVLPFLAVKKTALYVSGLALLSQSVGQSLQVLS